MHEHDDAYWKEKLTPDQYAVLREKGTEQAFTGKYWDTKEQGMYRCAGCGAELFDAATKFTATVPGLAGWPSFSQAKEGAVQFVPDTSQGMRRTEVVCARCGSHLGHVFDETHDGSDGTSISGKHFCINSCALDLEGRKSDND